GRHARGQFRVLGAFPSRAGIEMHALNAAVEVDAAFRAAIEEGDGHRQQIPAARAAKHFVRGHEVRRFRSALVLQDASRRAVLPAGFATDPGRLRRFEQEALAAASLNHPNILAVYDIGLHDGAPYIVSELLEGGTLRESLAAGALPVRKVLEYAVQITHGLAA